MRCMCARNGVNTKRGQSPLGLAHADTAQRVAAGQRSLA